MSDFVHVLSGVPEGSVLGPLVFNINDLHLHLRSKIFQYADETFLFRVINDDSHVQFLRKDLATLHWWSENNALQLNPQKCQVMCISRRKNKQSPEYFVSNTRLSTATSLRLLGVQISSDLTWNEQVSSVTKKCNKLLGSLRTVVGNQNQNILLTLYRSIVLPIIDFCSPVWLVLRKNHINNLETIQRRATRFILGQKRVVQSCGECLKQLNLMDLNNRRKYLSTCFACSCISNTTSSFVFSNWSVNSRHPDTLLLTIISLQRRIVLNSQLQPTSPVCGLSFQTQSGIILFYIACRLLKNILKVTLLKLAMLSWSWTPNLFTVI